MIQNEPELPGCLGTGSLVFAPTAGMRQAPELLVFELFREIGFGDSRHDSEVRKRELVDAIREHSMSEAEELLLATCRGRERKDGRAFFAPPYPGLARHGWLRKKTDRTVRDYFLGGPLAHHKRREGLDLELVARAVLGHHSAEEVEDCAGREILSLVAVKEREDPCMARMVEHLEELVQPRSAPLLPEEDGTAERMALDFLELCRVEAAIPRREWLFFLMAFLRISIAMWVLAQLRVTGMVRDWLVEACLGRRWPSEDEVLTSLQERHEGLLHPTSTPSGETVEHIERYMRARVELRLLVKTLEGEHPENFSR